MSKQNAQVKEEKRTVDVKYLDILELLPNPYQPESRVDVDRELAKKFALSFQEHGLIQTPVVRFVRGEGKISQEQFSNGHYEVADGWLRRAGFLVNLQEFGLEEYAKMPCMVRDLTDQQMADMVMEANMVRKDLNSIDLAKFYKRYLEDFKIPQAELARRHNCSQGEIANTIRLLELPGDIQEKIISQEISETHGRQLLRLNFNAELQQEILKQTVEQGYPVSELSNRIAQKIWWSSENIDPDDFPKPPFDTAACETCPNRQKIGSPYSHEGKKWRCLDKDCFAKKKEEMENKRAAQLAKEIAKAKKQAGKGESKKGGVAIIDCTSNKMTWRDYQDLESWKKIDNPEECKTCEYRAVGKFYNNRTSPICLNVKCFQAKEKALQAKQAAETRKAEQELSQEVKAVCMKVSDEASMVRVISTFLLGRCNKDPREKFMRLYGITNLVEYFMATEKVTVLRRLAALVLQIERYQGEKGRFMKMLADLNGTGAVLDKQIADFREAHCKTCRYDEDGSGCSLLIRVYLDEKCYRYYKVKEEEGEKKVGADSQEIPASCQDCLIQKECFGSAVWQAYSGNPACPNKKPEEVDNATV
jgi:ParB family chromosome partitioning protein